LARSAARSRTSAEATGLGEDNTMAHVRIEGWPTASLDP
jgi:hypothetical protein